jgi:hypothetical protein
VVKRAFERGVHAGARSIEGRRHREAPRHPRRERGRENPARVRQPRARHAVHADLDRARAVVQQVDRVALEATARDEHEGSAQVKESFCGLEHAAAALDRPPKEPLGLDRVDDDDLGKRRDMRLPRCHDGVTDARFAVGVEHGRIEDDAGPRRRPPRDRGGRWRAGGAEPLRG